MTYFVALPFVRGEDSELVAGDAIELQTAIAARRAAWRMAASVAGAVAFSRTGNPATGEFDDAVVLEAYGEVPTLDGLLAV